MTLPAPSTIKLPAIYQQSTSMKSLFTLLACSVLFSGPCAGAETYDARTAEKQPPKRISGNPGNGSTPAPRGWLAPGMFSARRLKTRSHISGDELKTCDFVNRIPIDAPSLQFLLENPACRFVLRQGDERQIDAVAVEDSSRQRQTEW
jgi:hypothetical protein